MNDSQKLYLTMILLTCFVAFIVNLPKQDKVTKNWARLFSLGQIILASQYAIGLVTGSLTDDSSYILSALNNLFFLGAALILLDRKNLSGNWRYLFSLRFFQVITLVTVLAILMKVPALVTGKESQKDASGLLIALVSILVYLVEGYAYYSILEFFRRKWIRYLPIFIAFSFSLIELCVYFDIQLNPVIAFMIPLRFLFYISPIMILLIRMPQDPEVKEVFENAIPERKFILSQETGLVEALGQSIAAHKVLLLIKRLNFNLDGSDSITEKFTYYGWQGKGLADKNIHDNRDDILADISEEERKCLYRVCQGDQHIFCKLQDGRETIMLPIIMYGGMIGVLFVRLNKGVRARSIFAEKLNLSIRTVLPLVQSSRQLAAIGMLSDHFTENLIGVAGIDKTDINETKLSVTEGVEEILVSMLKTLSPLAIALKPSKHFNSEKPVLWQVEETQFPVSKQDSFEKKYFTSEIDKNPLEKIKPFQQELEFGRMIMFVRQEKDSLDRPTIGIHENVFNALGAMINNALKTIIRRNLNRILAAADKRIREGGMDRYETAHVLQEAAKSFGISWIVIGLDQSRLFGDEDRVALIQQQVNSFAGEGGITERKITTEDGQDFWLITSSVNTSPKNNGHAQHRINFWFGMDNRDFTLDETWEGIFSQFIQLGTNKIKDLMMKEMVIEIETKIAEIEKDKAIMTLVHLQGNLAHQFGTFIKDLECDIKNLEADIKDLKLEVPEKIQQDIELLKASYNKLLELARAMFKDARLNKQNKRDLYPENVRPCDLWGAINKALEEVKLKLDLFKIKIETNFTGPDNQRELMVDAPYYVVYLSIANLLSNSIKALSPLTNQFHKKRINITTTVNEKHIFCRIKDTGQGIKRDKLYELESGWGLYLTKASLQDNNCTIEVLDSGPSNGTTFELRFPIHCQK